MPRSDAPPSSGSRAPHAAIAALRASGIGRYRVDAVLGSDGARSVLLAYDDGHKRTVSLLVFVEDDEAERARRARRARAAAGLDHPSIAAVHEIGAVGRVV